MALQSILTNISSASIAVNLGTTDDCLVAVGVTVSGANTGIQGTGASQNVTVMGAVFGGSTAISLSGAGSIGDHVFVAAGASVIGDNAALSVDSNNMWIDNGGSIASSNWGMYLTADGTGYSTVHNSGLITGWSCIGVNGPEHFYIVNTGRMIGQNYVLTADDVTETTMRNYGTMIGNLSFGDVDDSLVNRGFIDGQVRMGGGNDQVRNLGDFAENTINLGLGEDSYSGARATGNVSVYGDEGNDYFQLGEAHETINGAAGNDTLTYLASGQGITLLLETSGQNGGAAKGDEIYGVEQIYATHFADRIIGSVADNFLYGHEGADTLKGGDGADTLGGAQGVDLLTGGLGDDHFNLYGIVDEGVDQITDFTSAVGNNDVINPFAAGIFAGMATGALVQSQFRARNDNLAQDADDRFIFNKTDTTLWFDADGNGAAVGVMIADLQVGATLTFADIVIL